MDWDQRAFAWLYRAFRRVRGRTDAQQEDALVDSLTPRFETLSQLLTADRWEVLSGPNMGGVAAGSLVLPRQVAWLPNADDAARFYLYRVVIGAMSIALDPATVERWSAHQRSLAMMLGFPRARALSIERYPGASVLFEQVEPKVLERFPFDERARAARCFTLACRALLGVDPADQSGIDPTSSAARTIVETAATSVTAADLIAATARCGYILDSLGGGTGGDFASPWGRLLPASRDRNASLASPQDDPTTALPKGTERKMPRRSSEVTEVDLDSQKNRDNPLVHSFEKVHTATEYESGRKQLEASDQLAEHEEALRELDLSKVTRSGEKAESIYQADFRSYPHTNVADEGPVQRSHRYPEWSYKQRDYRNGWCTVNEELDPAMSSGQVVAQASRRLRAEVLHLRAELKRLELERRWRNRQLDGTEVDIDALVDRQSDLMARRSPERRIYVRRKPHDAELALLILIDSSSSSDSWVSGRRVFDVVRDSAQVLVEGFEPTSARLSISAFCSNTRRDCRYSLTKSFDEPARVGLQRLHAISPMGYTRIGPALRHSLRRMERSGARRRLIVLLTDAKPTDYDHYEGRYGVEDIRQALREAAEEGVHCLTLAVRDQGEPALTRMFGSHRWILLPAANALPSRFVSLARDFIRG